MSRTKRKYYAPWALENLNDDSLGSYYARHPTRKRGLESIIRGQDGSLRSDKCQTAKIDREGGFKLHTYIEAPSKKWGDVSRKRRMAGKYLIVRGLQDHYDELDEIEYDFHQEMSDLYHSLLLEEYERDLQDEIDQRELEAEMQDLYWDDYYEEYDDYDITHNTHLD